MSANQEKNLTDSSTKNDGGGTVNKAEGGKAEAKIEDRTGLYLAILAFGIACASISVNVMQYVSYSEIKTHVMLMDDAFQRWKMWAETHGFPGPEKSK